MNSITRTTMAAVVCFGSSLSTTNAQIDLSKWQIGVNVGTFIYQGDLTPSPVGSYRTLQPGFALYVSRVLNPSFLLRTNVAIGRLFGSDAVYSSPAWRRQRNFSFGTSVKEFSELLVWNMYSNNGNEYAIRFSPYAYAGVAVTVLNGYRFYGGMTKTFIATEPKAVEGLAADVLHPQSRLIAAIPIGAGVEYYLSRHFSLTGETCFRLTMSDYIDGFSLAANPSRKDYYHSHTIGLLYRFGKKDKYDCPKM